MTVSDLQFRNDFVALAIALGLTVSTAAPSAAFIVCKGPQDNLPLAQRRLKVRAQDAESFEAWMTQKFPGHGSVRAKGKWRIAYFILSPQDVSISISVSNQESRDPEDFEAHIETCNSKMDWRPVWQEFNNIVNASPYKS